VRLRGKRWLGAGAIALGVLVGVPAAPALAASSWSAADPISQSGTAGEVPQVAIDKNGNALAVWRLQDPEAGPANDKGRYRVQFSSRARGEAFSKAVPGPEREQSFISGPERDVGAHIRLAMNDDGDAIVVWEAVEDNGKVGIRSSYRPAGGDWGPEQVVRNDPGNPDFRDSFVEPEVGIDGEGNATVLFHLPPLPFGDQPQDSSIISFKTRPAGESSDWSPTEQPLISHQATSETNPTQYTETEPWLSVDEDGDRRAIFTSRKFESLDPNRPTDQEVVVVRSPAGASDWSVERRYPSGSRTVEQHSLLTEERGSGQVDMWTHGDDVFAGYNGPAG